VKPPASQHGRPKRFTSSSYSDNEEDEGKIDEDEHKAFWDECEQVAKKTPAPTKAPVVSRSGGGSASSGMAGSTSKNGGDRGRRKADKNEVSKCSRELEPVLFISAKYKLGGRGGEFNNTILRNKVHTFLQIWSHCLMKS